MKFTLKKLLAILIILFAITGCENTPNNDEDEDADLDGLISYEDNIENNSNLTPDEQERQKKLEEIRKKLALKGLIANGDMYFEEKEYVVALSQYLKALKDLPNDNEIQSKIGDIYYEQKKYDKAYEYYSKVKSYTGLDKRKAIYSLLNGLYAVKGSDYVSAEIDSFGLSQEESFYYKNATICISNFSKCRANFEKYFEGVDSNNEDIQFADLKTIRNTFTNYKNFQIEDLVYKAALVTGGFYTNGFYFVSLRTGEDILKDNPNYKPVIKIVAKSAYELGDYSLAKEYLLGYNKIETNDADASYFLGRIYEKLGDRLLSSVHLEKALKLGYPDQNDIRRRMIFLYYDMNKNEQMLAKFQELIGTKSKDLTINDYNLAIYYHILEEDYTTAKTYANEAISLFPDSELFYGYLAWILLQKDDTSKAHLDEIKYNLDTALKINNQNPMLSLVEGIYFMKTGENERAILRLKNAKLLDRSLEYSESIDYFLNMITDEKK